MRAMELQRHASIQERPLVAVERPDPVPGPGEILVQVSACAVCRTDLHVIEGDLPDARLPLVPGHQAVGRVVSGGPGASRFAPGERVGIAWLRHTCGTCRFCAGHAENLCAASRYTGYHADGGYATHAVVPQAYAYLLPEALDDVSAAPLLCAGIIGYRALRRARVPVGGRLGLYGFGSSAHLVLGLALHGGCEVLVVTRARRHRELALELGASWAGGPEEEPPVPLDSAIVFAPAGSVVPRALRAVDRGGTVVLAGVTMSPVPEMEYETCLFHEKSLRSVEAATRRDGAELLQEAAAAGLRPRVQTYPLSEASSALLALARSELDGSAVLLMPPEG